MSVYRLTLVIIIFANCTRISAQNRVLPASASFEGIRYAVGSLVFMPVSSTEGNLSDVFVIDEESREDESVLALESLVSDIEVYPNPSSTGLQVTGLQEPIIGVLTDSNGRTINTLNQSNYLDIRGIKSGLYYLRFYNHDRLLRTVKILKTQ